MALLFLCAGINAQKLKHEYVNGISRGTSKSDSIEGVVYAVANHLTSISLSVTTN